MFGFKIIKHVLDDKLIYQILWPWICKTCDGTGDLTFGMKFFEPCQDCKESGYNWQWFIPVDQWWFNLKVDLVQMKYNHFIRRCTYCHKIEKFLWLEMGNHSDCLPF